MVSPDSSTEASASASASTMEEKEKRFYSRTTPSLQPPSNSSPSESQSDSSEQISNLPPKKTPAKTPTTTSKPPLSSGKRPRNEDEEPTNKKTKKPKPTKEDPKKISEDKKKVKQPDPAPSPQKSAKKPNLWSPKEDINFLKALVAYCQDGKEFPKNNLTPVYEFVRGLNLLEHEYSNTQLGEKFRRMRTKFVNTEEKVKGGGRIFKIPHDEIVYKLSKKIWGREEEKEEEEEVESEENDSADVGNGTKEDIVVKKDEEEEEDDDEKDAEEEENKSTGEDVEMTQRETEEVEEEDEEVETNADKQNRAFPGMRKHAAVKEAVKKPNVVSNGPISNGVQGNNDEKLIDQLRKETSVIMNEIKDQMSRENKEFKGAVMKMVREGLQGSGNGKTRNGIGFSSEVVVKKLYSARELPALDVAEAKVLEKKWQRQLLAELEACSGHLTLLQEECQKRKEKLVALVDEERH